MEATLAFNELEIVYDLLAEAIDEAGPENESLLLSKLCITLAHKVSELAIIKDAIELAKKDLLG